jgi:hypothetical protein
MHIQSALPFGVNKEMYLPAQSNGQAATDDLATLMQLLRPAGY